MMKAPSQSPSILALLAALLALALVHSVHSAATTTEIYSNVAELAATGAVEYVGRIDLSGRGEWSGTGIQMYVIPTEGTTMPTTITINYTNCTGNCKYFIETLVDCSSLMTTEISENVYQFVVVSMVLPSEGYDFKFIKRTEAGFGECQGVMQFGDITISNGGLGKAPKADDKKNALRGSKSSSLSSCSTSSNRILFIGDSITAAFGVDGTDPCPFAAATENIEHSYATLVANEVGATAHILAWSGIGVVHNNGDPNQASTTNMPVLYNRTIPTESASFWLPGQFSPDVVYVMLGTNDFSTSPHPTNEQFQSGYAAFLTQIRADYPSAKIMIACAPMKNSNQCDNVAAVATNNADLVSAYLDIPTTTMTTSGSNGCGGHPSRQAHVNMASLIVPVMQKLLAYSKI
jgi:lysophospholipase L1-like esterase